MYAATTSLLSLTAVLALITALAMLAAPWLVWVFAPGFGRDPAKLFGSPGAGCEFIDRKDDGATYRFRIACSGDTTVTGTGEMRYSRDAIDGQIVLNMAREGQKVETRTAIRARRTGPCAGPK